MEFCGSETAEDEQKIRQTSRDIADANKITSDGNKQRIATKKEKDQRSEREDTKLMHQFYDENVHHQKMQHGMEFCGSETVFKEQETRQTSRDIADVNKITSDGKTQRIDNKKEKDQRSEREDTKLKHQFYDENVHHQKMEHGMEFCGSETVFKEQETRQTSRDIADVNKITSDGNKRRIANKKEKDQWSEREDTKLVHQLLDYEATEKEHHQDMEQEAVDDYEAEQKVTRDRKEQDEKDEDELAEDWYEYQNKVRGEEQRATDQMHQDQDDQHTARYNTNFDNLQTLQDNEKKTYDDFIEKGIRTSENRILAQEKTCVEKLKQDHETAMSVSRDNQTCAIKDNKRKADKKHQSNLYDEKMNEQFSSWKGDYE